MPVDQAFHPADVVHVNSDEQLRAVTNLVRHRILAVLRDTPATMTQIAAKLNLRKGSSSYHLRLLERAGLVRVVATRRVRGVVERYYAPVARRIEFDAPGQSSTLLRHALADLQASPRGDDDLVRVLHTRLSPHEFAEFRQRVDALIEQVTRRGDPQQPAATMAVAFLRPAADDAAPAGP